MLQKKAHFVTGRCIINTTYAVSHCQALEENRRQAEQASMHRRWPSKNISINIPVGRQQPVDVIPSCASEAVTATSIIWSTSPLLHRHSAARIDSCDKHPSRPISGSLSGNHTGLRVWCHPAWMKKGIQCIKIETNLKCMVWVGMLV